MKSTRVLIRAKGRGLCIERGLYDCLQKELFADVTLKCEGGQIRANKGVLAAASPVLCNLLKDWPATEDPCVIMAGYTEEEVQGLVRYIYTGQLSAPRIHGSSWEKIIGDFKVGSPFESDDDLASIHELSDYDDSSSIHESSAPNGQHLQQPHQQHPFQTVTPKSPSKGIGPKIVAVTSPRPLIVQVQSLNQPQTVNQDYDSADIEDNEDNDIPNEMVIEDDLGGTMSDTEYTPVAVKRKRVGKKFTRGPYKKKKKVEDIRAASEAGTAKKLGKKSKPTSKFSRKKYLCTHCNRRFLTRGNVKNHLRTHSRDKPFQCPVCQDLFAYQAVFQRHLIKHQTNSEIAENELAPMIAESIRLADEIGLREQESVRCLDEDEAEENRISEPQDTENDLGEEDDDENTELIEEEEAKFALKTIGTSKHAGSSKNQNDTGSNSNDGEVGAPIENENDEENEKTALKTDTTSNIKGKQSVKDSKEQPTKMNLQVIECDFCPMKYHKWSAFYIHRCSHTGELPVIPCGNCELEFPNIKALKAHKTAEHPETIFQCDECDRNFLSKSALVLHQAVHSTKLNYPCRYCPKKMRTVKERYLHEKMHTTDDTSFQCTHCQKKFNSLVNLRSHLKVHAKEEDSSAV